MEISKEDFEQMKAKYDNEVKNGKPAQSKIGDVSDQTSWIFFSRADLEAALADSDSTKGGIKFYFTEYTAESAQKYHPENPAAYEGRLALVYCASNNTTESDAELEDGETYYNRGQMCPPWCE
jgi:hypothetical protein